MSSCQKTEDVIEIGLESNNISIHNRTVDICFTSYNIGAFCEELPLVGDVHNTINDNGGPEAYGNAICEMVNAMGSDIVNLQEVWCEEVADAITECMGEDVDIEFDIGSGLMTISTLPILETSFTGFNKGKGFDALKGKGFLSTTIEIDDPDSENGNCELILINTHLQADGGLTDGGFIPALTTGMFNTTRGVRESQLGQIEDHIEDQDPCTPILIGGDLNIERGTEEFNEMLDVFAAQPAHLVTRSPTSTSGSTLDYYIINSYDDHLQRFNDVSTTVFDGCTEYSEVSRYRVRSEWLIEEDWDEVNEQTDIFNTLHQAQNFLDDLNPDDVVSAVIEQVTIRVCTNRLENVSDHHPIQTCFDDFDCDAEC